MLGIKKLICYIFLHPKEYLFFLFQVGFSKGVDDKLPPLTDGTVAVYNLKAMLAFYVKFPNMKKNDLYLTG